MKNSTFFQILLATLKPQPELSNDNPIANLFQVFINIGPVVLLACKYLGLTIAPAILHFFLVYHILFACKDGLEMLYDAFKSKSLPVYIDKSKLVSFICSVLIISFYFFPAGIVAIQWFNLHVSALIEGTIDGAHMLHCALKSIRTFLLLVKNLF